MPLPFIPGLTSEECSFPIPPIPSDPEPEIVKPPSKRKTSDPNPHPNPKMRRASSGPKTDPTCAFTPTGGLACQAAMVYETRPLPGKSPSGWDDLAATCSQTVGQPQPSPSCQFLGTTDFCCCLYKGPPSCLTRYQCWEGNRGKERNLIPNLLCLAVIKVNRVSDRPFCPFSLGCGFQVDGILCRGRHCDGGQGK